MSSWTSTQFVKKLAKKLPEPETELEIKRSELTNTKLKNITYNAPTCTDTAVILVFFNPISSIRIQQNILYVNHQLKKAKIPVFIGELCFNDEPSLFEESDSVFIFRSTSYMFYKENLINQVISKPAVRLFEKYVILDADIIFEDIDWVDKISSALEKHDIIQPYDFACILYKNFTVNEVINSICNIDPLKEYPKIGHPGHPGYAWAFRRDWFDRVGGLFEYALIGGGDVCLSYLIGITKKIDLVYSWDMKMQNLLTNIGCIPGIISHLPHGSMHKKQYSTRLIDIQEAIRIIGIKKLSDATERNTHGVFEWKKQYKEIMNNVLYEYFKNRDDDNFD